MTPQLYIILALYFGVNLYLTGRNADSIEGEWWRHVAYHVLFGLFAALIYVWFGLYGGVERLFTLFQVKTLWQLYVLRKHRDYTVEKLEYLNKYQDQSKTFRGRMFRWAVRLVNKANNYDPNPARP